MSQINLGRVGFVNKGAHNIATAYKVNDVVTYNSGTYACIQAHTGQLPTATAYWQNWVANDKALDSAVVHKTGDTMYGNLNFASGTKITGDFSNATIASRTALQTSVLNSPTRVMALPNGTSDISQYACVNNQDPTNASFATMQCSNSLVAFSSSISGSGTYLPMVFLNGGLERLRIDTAGNVGIGTSSPTTTEGRTLHLSNPLNEGTIASNSKLIIESNRNSGLQFKAAGASSISFSDLSNVVKMQMNIGQDGALVQVIGTGIGYGTGSGGTVTQLTSKSTAVTLNKPCGKITMNNASLTANSSVQFNINNSSIADGDSIKVTIVGGVGSYQSYSVDGYGTYGGGASIVLRNVTAGALAEAVVLQFNITKGATA